eukprot:3929607-Prymnesium_polylepis.2
MRLDSEVPGPAWLGLVHTVPFKQFSHLRAELALMRRSQPPAGCHHERRERRIVAKVGHVSLTTPVGRASVVAVAHGRERQGLDARRSLSRESTERQSCSSRLGEEVGGK